MHARIHSHTQTLAYQYYWTGRLFQSDVALKLNVLLLILDMKGTEKENLICMSHSVGYVELYDIRQVSRMV